MVLEYEEIHMFNIMLHVYESIKQSYHLLIFQLESRYRYLEHRIHIQLLSCLHIKKI